ncbi:hypothetical protein F442_02241 [Phytophthora nicotianae P10297]|uniref:DUF6570 domain-containing protein n=1 Tax=Phytophthora nicotianae P10297 TaxID=1317064 RepID=W2ZZU2_PHYNI|nr:hypothetical protein F442_02241 [Phytophthora nicotianae P10297]
MPEERHRVWGDGGFRGCVQFRLRRNAVVYDVFDWHLEQWDLMKLFVLFVIAQNCYRCVACLSLTLNGVLLSKRGVRPDGDLNICGECDDSLVMELIPKFSIKNGFYVGTLPSRLADITLPERLMTQMVSLVAVTRVMRGRSHRSIRSHCLVFDATPGPPATLLPIPVDDITSYRVVFAGPFTTEQQASVRQMHRVRRQVVDDVLKFYRQHNGLYEMVTVDCSEVSLEAIAETLIYEDVNADVEVSALDADHNRVGGVSDNDVCRVKSDIVERRVVFISDDHEVSTQDGHVVSANTSQSVVHPQFLVRHSS